MNYKKCSDIRNYKYLQLYYIFIYTNYVDYKLVKYNCITHIVCIYLIKYLHLIK